ncbi:hypothetical protein AVEN_271923-1, partial [Araneus ventricosus]
MAWVKRRRSPFPMGEFL